MFVYDTWMSRKSGHCPLAGTKCDFSLNPLDTLNMHPEENVCDLMCGYNSKVTFLLLLLLP